VQGDPFGPVGVGALLTLGGGYGIERVPRAPSAPPIEKCHLSFLHGMGGISTRRGSAATRRPELATGQGW
jgi:hypothetical protein